MNKKFFSFLSVMAMSIFFFLTSTVNAADIQCKRLAGSDRYQTGSKIVSSGWTASDYAVIASGEGFADALCAAPLAQKYKAPILLTSKDTLDANTKNELTRLKVKKVFIIGGCGVISNNIESQMHNMNIEATRIYGQDRFETCLQVAKNLDVSNGVVVTNGYGFADALSIAPIAAQKGMPILLTESSDLPSSIKAFLSNKTYDKSFILGGSGVVSDKIASQLKNNKRLGGASRYETNAAVLNNFASELNYDNVYVASGENYPDALSGSALASSTNSPLILVGNSIDPSVMNSVKAQHDKYKNIVLLGGSSVVTDILAKSIVSGIDTTIVRFKDKKLENDIREKINKPTGDIYKNDVIKITEFECQELNVPNCVRGQSGIGDINGIENLENLEYLDLGWNHISDLTPLKGLTKLKKLELYRNKISDISPLKGLTNLQSLNLYMNVVNDISALDGLNNLEDIDLQRNRISDIGPLKGLTNLKALLLNNNEISDINSLKNLTNLKTLGLAGNQISDIDTHSLKQILSNCEIDGAIESVGLSTTVVKDHARDIEDNGLHTKEEAINILRREENMDSNDTLIYNGNKVINGNECYMLVWQGVDAGEVVYYVAINTWEFYRLIPNEPTPISIKLFY